MQPRPHWSYSQISQYLRCPLQYYFQRILKLPEPWVSSNLVLGSAVHAALAEYHNRLRLRQDCSREEIQEAFLGAWKEREEQQPVDYRRGQDRTKAIDQGVALLELYLSEPPPQNIVGVEQRFMVPLHNSRGEILEKPLVAILDLICEDKDGLKIVELKTSGRKYSEMETATSLQVTCYLNAIREKYDRSASLYYKILVKTKTPQVQEIKTERTPADIDRLGDLVEMIELAIAGGVFYPVENVINCSTCVFRQPCKEWKGAIPSNGESMEKVLMEEAIAC
jgi:putative RecB family exonuclease